ncbi:FKBP-type peptidyl-prolyl cis-trans isomerase [Luminiphilus syltensis]|nr:FKBP-type peptidyl-prolyl cis-trans isomerase [Luminiphilus syltensis]
MRSIFTRRATTLLIAPMFVGVLTACQEQAKEPEPVTLDTPNERLAYGVALRMGQRMKSDGMELDVDAYALGLRDAMEGNDAKLTDEEINAEMIAFQEKLEADQQAQREAMATANTEAGVAFLEENARREGVVVTDSGLQYEVIEAGDGDKPTSEDTVEVHYRGTLIDGQEFDSSYSRGQTVKFGVTQVIAGWTEALQLMSEGAKYKLFIPSELAYGAGGAGEIIGPNATLVFDVELVDVVDDDAEETEE